MSTLFQEMYQQSATSLSIRRKIAAMVEERKAALDARKLLSGVALPPVTDLEQAIDSWI